MDAIGVVLSPNDDGKYDVYRVTIADGKLVYAEPVRLGENRVKRSAIKVAERDLLAISQMFTRGQVEFGEVEDA
jgi:hypothetical protein